MSSLRFKKLINFDFEKHSQKTYDRIQDLKLKGRHEIKNEGAYVGFVDVFKNNNFIYIKAYKEFKRDAGYYDGDPKNLKRTTNIEGKYHPILITRQGYIIHERSSFFHDLAIKELLTYLFNSIGLSVSIEDINRFELKTMRTFFKTSKKVISLTIKKIGDVAPNPRMPPEEIEKATQDMGSASTQIQITSGRDKNLRDSQVINEGLARRSDIREIRGLDNEGDTFTINANGKIDIHLPKEEMKQSYKLYRIVEKILGILE